MQPWGGVGVARRYLMPRGGQGTDLGWLGPFIFQILGCPISASARDRALLGL